MSRHDTDVNNQPCMGGLVLADGQTAVNQTECLIMSLSPIWSR